MTTEPTEPPAAERTALYRLYDAGDQLLYVGITRNPERRWSMHSYTAARTWWPKVARKAIEWHPSREAAAAAELVAISTEAPAFNVAGTPSPLRLDGETLVRPVNKRAAEPEYEQVAAELREAIQRGDLAPGDRLPSFAELREHFGVTVTTAQRALRVLKDAGLVEGRKGSGVYVKPPTSRTITIPIGRPEEAAEILRQALSPDNLAVLVQSLTQGLPAEVAALRARLAEVRHLLVDDDELFNNGVSRAISILSDD